MIAPGVADSAMDGALARFVQEAGVRMALVVDETGAEEHPQVLAHGRGRRPRGRSQCPGPLRSGAELLDDGEPRRVGQRRERPRKVLHDENS